LVVKQKTSFRGWKKRCLKRSSLTVLLLIIIGSMAVGYSFERVSAAPEDSVQMYPGTYAHTLGTPADIVKLDYPKSSIMQNTTGDFSLNLTLSGDRSSMAIYIPPEFSFLQPDTTSIWTSITNDYKHISIIKLSSRDPIGPFWWRVTIANLTIPRGSHAVRMFDIKAPDVCDRYFLKFFIDGKSIGSESFPTVVVKGDLDPAYISGRVLNGDRVGYYGYRYGLPVNVSGKVVAEGTTALGRAVKAQAYFNASANGCYTLYGLAAGTYELTASAAGFPPVTLGQMITVMAGQSLDGVDIYLNPSATVSGTVWSKCKGSLIQWNRVMPIRIVLLDLNANMVAYTQGFVDPSAYNYNFTIDGRILIDGHVPQDYADYVSGLDLGDYYVKVYVNGYLQSEISLVYVVDYLSSLKIQIDIEKSGWLEVTVHFKEYANGSTTPLSSSRLLTLEAYDLQGTLKSLNGTIVPPGSPSWTLNLTGFLGTEFDYGLPQDTYMITARITGYIQLWIPQATIGFCSCPTRLSFDLVKSAAVNVTVRSVDWQWPPQEVEWAHPGAPIRLEVISSAGDIALGFSKQPEVPATRVYMNATDLSTGTYFIKAYTTGYIQRETYTFSITIGSAGDLVVDLVRGAKLNVLINFKTEELFAPIDTYPYDPTFIPLRVEVYDSFGTFVGANVSHIPGTTAFQIDVVGFNSYAGDPAYRWTNYYDTTDGNLQEDYGLTSSTYLVYAWVPGYVQRSVVTATVDLGGAATVIFDLHRLSHIYGQATGYNMFGEVIPISWATVSAYGPILMATSSLDGFYEMWLENGTYMLAASLVGYETQATEVRVSMGSETWVDFNLKPSGTPIPELPATELTLLAVLIMAYTLMHGKKSPGGSFRSKHKKLPSHRVAVFEP